MDDNRNMNHQHGQNRNRHNRFRHGRPGGGHQAQRGRPQRPLLTSALNGMGFCLIALTLMNKETHAQAYGILGVSLVLFGLSALVSYVAQRSRPFWIERISDLLFLAGLILVIWVGGTLSGVWTSLGIPL